MFVPAAARRSGPSESPALSALNLSQEPAEKYRKRTRVMEFIPHKRTKIVATIGPASNDPAIMRSLFLSGANVVRLNFSHGTPDDHGIVIDNVRKISADLNIHTAVLQDLPGPKVRTGKLAPGLASVKLERGKTLTLVTDEIEGTAEKIS